MRKRLNENYLVIVKIVELTTLTCTLIRRHNGTHIRKYIIVYNFFLSLLFACFCE